MLNRQTVGRVCIVTVLSGNGCWAADAFITVERRFSISLHTAQSREATSAKPLIDVTTPSHLSQSDGCTSDPPTDVEYTQQRSHLLPAALLTPIVTLPRDVCRQTLVNH